MQSGKVDSTFCSSFLANAILAEACVSPLPSKQAYLFWFLFLLLHEQCAKPQNHSPTQNTQNPESLLVTGLPYNDNFTDKQKKF